MPRPPISIEQAVVAILTRDQRYAPGAYFAVKESLDVAIEKNSPGSHNHVSGPELLAGFRTYMVNEYGPMSGTLLDAWGMRVCRDVGEIVFNFIKAGYFGKQESDKPEDFEGDFTFYDAFRRPFEPSGKGLGSESSGGVGE